MGFAMKKALLLIFAFTIAAQPAAITCMQKDPQNGPWSPFTLISQAWQNITLQAQKHPYIAWGIGLGAAACAVVGAVYYCHSGQKPPATQEQKESVITDSTNKPVANSHYDQEEVGIITDPTTGASTQLTREQNLIKTIEKKPTSKEQLVTTKKPLDFINFSTTQTPPTTQKQEQPISRNKEQKPINFTTTNKIEKKPNLNRSVSMVHLTRLISGQVTFVPEPTTKTDLKNKLSYLDCYDQIKTDDDQQTLKKFMEHLIGKIYANYETMFVPPISSEKSRQLVKNGAIDEYNEKCETRKQETIQTLTSVLLNEENHPDKIVFYHGHRGALKFFHDFVSVLHQYLDCIKKTMFRSRFEGKEIFPLTDENLKKFGKDMMSRDWGKGYTLLSSNIALFGNLNDSGENTIGYCYYNSSMSGNYIKDANNLATQIGLSIDDEMKRLMSELYKKYEMLSGVLKQIFISPTYVDTLSYISHPLGIPYKFLSNNSNLVDQEATDYWNKLIPESLNTSKITEFIRTSASDSKLSTDMLDRLQARVICNSEPFTDPTLAEKCGIEIVDYFAKTEDNNLHKKLREDMDVLIQKILVTTLEKNTLKGGAEKTKLVEFYKNNKQLPTLSELK